MKIRRDALLGVGIAIGYVLGARAGRQRYEQLALWARKTSDDLGLRPAVNRVVDTARETAVDLRDSAENRAHVALDSGSRAVSETVRSAADALKAGD